MKWEYTIETRNTSVMGFDESQFLKIYGDEGWELVSVRSVGEVTAVYYFKQLTD